MYWVFTSFLGKKLKIKVGYIDRCFQQKTRTFVNLAF